MSGSLGQSVLHRLLHALLSLIFGQRDVGCSCAILYLDMQVSTIDGDRSWFSVGGLGHKYRRCVGIGNQVSIWETRGCAIVLGDNDCFLTRNVMLLVREQEERINGSSQANALSSKTYMLSSTGLYRSRDHKRTRYCHSH